MKGVAINAYDHTNLDAMASWEDLPLELRMEILKRNTDRARALWFRRRKIRVAIQLRFPYGWTDGRYMYRYTLGTPTGFFMWYSYWENLDEPHRCYHVPLLRWPSRRRAEHAPVSASSRYV